MNSWNGKLNLRVEEKVQLKIDYLMLKPIWRSEDGSRKTQR